MAKIGILFDIDDLGGGLYGYTAYQIFFDAIDTEQICGCSLSDGDTSATLEGRANHYCIAVESFEPSKLATVKEALSTSSAKGLLPLGSRFTEGPLVDLEPLVQAAYIDHAGELTGCQTSWITTAWQKSREKE